MREFRKSHKLDGVLYDIRGPILAEAKRFEEEGYRVLKLNIGNTAPFGLNAPDEMIHDMILNLQNAQGYCDSKGLFSARKAVVHYCQRKGFPEVDIEDVFIGNGVSELIVMAMQGLLDNGDELLIPSPDYPLWTAAVTLCGGKPVHYLCDEESDWYPDVDDIREKVTEKTKGIVIINPNNPTGSVYPREILAKIVEIAEEKELILFSDEIYDKIVYDENSHISAGSISDTVLTVTFNGLSKAYRASGFRAGWMILSGNKRIARDYMEGLDMLSNMRLCSNVPAQFAVQTALGGYQSIDDLVKPGGRLFEQRDACMKGLEAIPGISCVKPKGALYCFPRIDIDRFGITSDVQFVLDFLRDKKILLVQGTGFNWPRPDHFRIVFLPREDELAEAMDALKGFLSSYRQK